MWPARMEMQSTSTARCTMVHTSSVQQAARGIRLECSVLRRLPAQSPQLQTGGSTPDRRTCMLRGLMSMLPFLGSFMPFMAAASNGPGSEARSGLAAGPRWVAALARQQCLRPPRRA